ncbi:OadG-related small transporter subunit [Lutispora thermophila]|uniref:Oxaloacetate decarboxylase, gamma chain n=1 Tax=Lutispora thermophila DSM 19022 TaxID=1122184 RepID=A0A1M6IDI1_9FIRM|nr:OadG-related small transporter subunit [Lutispora thermophila]SHJ32528.1 hypothetical protein SAMN02745176_03207 [Lutispora thermophila DSM 19022]
MEIQFTAELLPQALGVMVKGMGGIFAVLFTIYLASVLLQKLFPEMK